MTNKTQFISVVDDELDIKSQEFKYLGSQTLFWHWNISN